MDPQETASGLPFDEDVALKEPEGSPFIVSLSKDVVIYGWICWREPDSLTRKLDLVSMFKREERARDSTSSDIITAVQW